MLVSVIIPAFNVAGYIREAVYSVLNQTHTGIEIIVVDDHSSDSTFEILKELQKEIPEKLVLLQNPENKGASHSRNKGLAIANGEYIQFLDADDLLLPQKIESQISKVQTGSPLIIGNYKRQTIRGEQVEKPFGKTDEWVSLANSTLGITSANLWPKNTVSEVGGWNESLKSSQEYDLMFRLLKTDVKVIFDESYLTIVRDRPAGSISQLNLAASWRRYINLRIEIYQYLDKAGMLTDLRRNALLQRLFEVLRLLYKYDSKSAVSIYRNFIFRKYAPKTSTWISKSYLLLYRLLGFTWAEKIRMLFKK